MSDLLFPEETLIDIPQQPAELGQWLRKHGADEETIKIFVGKYDDKYDTSRIWRAKLSLKLKCFF